MTPVLTRCSQYIGKDKHVLTYPIAQLVQGETKPMVNLVAFVSEPAREGSQYEGAWVRPAPTTDLLSTFKGWEEEVQALIEVRFHYLAYFSCAHFSRIARRESPIVGYSYRQAPPYLY